MVKRKNEIVIEKRKNKRTVTIKKEIKHIICCLFIPDLIFLKKTYKILPKINNKPMETISKKSKYKIESELKSYIIFKEH